jgi:hypothetical protein
VKLVHVGFLVLIGQLEVLVWSLIPNQGGEIVEIQQLDRMAGVSQTALDR